MLKILFMLMSIFTTPEERDLAKRHYSGVPIAERYYFSGHHTGSGGDGSIPGDPVAAQRWYVDKSWMSNNKLQPYNSTLWMFHFENRTQGLGYQQGFYLLRKSKWVEVEKGKFVEQAAGYFLFAFDHSVPWDGKPIEVQRGKEP